MIIVSKTVADADSRQLKLRNYQISGSFDNVARISRYKTLDGGSVFSHYGVTDTDRNFNVQCRMPADDLAVLQSLFESADLVRISFWEGAYSGYIYSLKHDRNGVAKIVFYFKEKLT